LLLDAALMSVRKDLDGPGAFNHPDGPTWLRLYALRSSRRQVAARDRIARPRHVLIYRFDPEVVDFLAVLDQQMDMSRRVRGFAHLGERR
jgi:hypothetical protein